MARLTKAETRQHNAALERFEKTTLTDDDREFIFNNYHEGANPINGDAGAFFTPLDLAWDFSLEVPNSNDPSNGLSTRLIRSTLAR